MHVAVSPPFSDSTAFSDFYSRLHWYLTPLRPFLTRISLFRTGPEVDVTGVPSYLDPGLEALFGTLPIEIETVPAGVLDGGPVTRAFEAERLQQAGLILCWSADHLPTDPDIRQRVVLVDPVKADQGHRMLYLRDSVAPPDPAVFKATQQALRRLMDTVAGPVGSIFGTGPNLAMVETMDVSDGVSIACNSMVRNTRLMDQLTPPLIVAADPVFHAGPSTYAATFRADLAQAMDRYGSTLIVPMRHRHVYESALPDTLKDRIVGIPVMPNVSVPNMDLTDSLFVAGTGNVLTLFLLPLAATLFERIHVLGCDGRPLHEDDYFWTHDTASQITDKMADVQAAHPAFFARGYNEYYVGHCRTLERWVQAAEARGRTIVNLTPSHIPALNRRSPPGVRHPVSPDLWPLIARERAQAPSDSLAEALSAMRARGGAQRPWDFLPVIHEPRHPDTTDDPETCIGQAGRHSDHPRLDGATLDETQIVGQIADVQGFLARQAGTGGQETPSWLVDVGAHHGAFLRPFVQRGWRVLAVEPEPVNHATLMAGPGSHPAVTVAQVALADAPQGEAAFFTAPDSTGVAALSPFLDSHSESARVSVETLTQLLERTGVPRVDVLKVDTEGWDLRVLQGLDWSRWQPGVVMVEYENAKTEKLGYTVDDMAAFLEERDYVVFVSEWHPVLRYGTRHDWRRFMRWSDGHHPDTRLDPDGWGNLIAVRRHSGIPHVSALKGLVHAAASIRRPSLLDNPGHVITALASRTSRLPPTSPGSPATIEDNGPVIEAAGTTLVFWPDATDLTPYQALLAEALPTGVRAEAGDLHRAQTLLDAGAGRVIFHIHALAPVIGDAPSDAAARAAATAFVAALGRFRAGGGAVIWTLHVPPDRDWVAGAVLGPDLIARFISEVSCIHLMSQAGLDWIATHVPEARSRCLRAPHPGLFGLYPESLTRSQARAHLGVRPDQTLFLVMGPLRETSGITSLAEAFGRLAPVEPEALLMVVGPMRPPLDLDQVRARFSGIPRVSVPGQDISLDQMPLLYAAADYAVLPQGEAVTEGTLVRPLSFGCPVIAPDTPAVTDLMADGAGGLLYDRRAAAGDLLIALRRAMMEDADTRRAQRASALEAVRPHTWPGLAAALCRAVAPDGPAVAERTRPGPLPRVLIVDLTPIGGFSATGRVKEALFRDWSEADLLVAHLDGPLNAMVLGGRGGHRLSGPLEAPQALAHIRAFGPDLIYYRAVDNETVHAFAGLLKQALPAVPMAVHIMDDWPERLRRSDPQRHAVFDTTVRGLFAHARVRLAIGTRMAEAFEARYGGPFVPFANAVDPGDYAAPARSRGATDPIVIRYAGALAEDMTLASVQAVARAVQTLSARIPVRLEILTRGVWLETARQAFGTLSAVHVLHQVPADQYPAALQDSDALLIAYNFDDESMAYTRYSIANKMPEYMAAGRPILAIGPADLATIDSLRRDEAAWVIDSPNPARVEAALAAFLTDADARDRLARRGRHLAETTYAIDTVAQRFRDTLIAAATG